MQTLTFTQKLLRQRSFLSSLIPLFAIFLGLGASQRAMGQAYYNFDNVTISASTTSAAGTSTTYDGIYDPAALPPYNPFLEGADFGSGMPNSGMFDQATGASTLILTAAEANVGTANTSTNITGSTVYYRVYLSGTAATSLPSFSPIVLSRNPSGGSTTGSSLDYTNSAAGVDLLHQPAVLGGGTYVVEVKFVTTYTTTGRTGTTPGTVQDLGTTNPGGYQATFTVKAPLVTPSGGTTTWISTTNTASGTDWNNATNWSNGVPTATSNAVINAPTSTVRYAYPVLDSPIGGPINTYSVNNLTLNGSSNSVKGQLFVQLATLAVYGNIRQPAGGLVGTTTGAVGVADPAQNSTLILAGADQLISGQLNMPDVIVAGSGTKSVINVLAPLNTLSFRPTSVANGVIIQSASEDNVNNAIVTVFNTTGNTYIDLGSSGLINQAAGYAETNSSYVKGVLRSSRRMSSGVTQTFGNIGLELTPNHTPVGIIGILRVVGEPQLAPIGNGVGIKRVFTIRGDDDSETSTYAGTGSFVRFRYLDSADELNTIQEANLLMFLSFNLSGPYAPRDGTVNTTLNYFDRAFLDSYPAYNLTLGDRTRPLPITLTKFDAKRMGADALVTWQTASEQNSKGFEVQVSTDGKEFRTLGMVQSKTPNSATAQSYSYLDTESGKTGIRYYRLHQIDLDGKESFFAPVAVSFEGKASASTSMVAFPNPFSTTDEVHLSLQSTTSGTGKLLVTDMMGRTIIQRNVELASGLVDVPVSGLNSLKTGLYVIKLTLPSGEVKTLKATKQ
ncbi:T9SS type A sorting domain-containing protein [Hymenobacter rubidus]|uniref:T9SS type A sorting domain-containing protein n=1 Tax=Hymenobacter rubidus TaxID=1441626 RepID=UPI00191EAA8A|nr:T9SS type A sorting domain-containing protein [Hymenobacter rubidus]